MTEKIIDARNMLCPKPVMLASQALNEANPGDTIVVLVDNRVASENVVRFFTGRGVATTSTTEPDKFTIRATITEVCPTCQPMTDDNQTVVVAITGTEMGHGSAELGRILMQSCINALPALSPRPTSVVFYNQGVELACKNSPVLASLNELKQKGTEILVCGTCLNYFSLTDQLEVGIISNMHEILTVLGSAAKLIKP